MKVYIAIMLSILVVMFGLSIIPLSSQAYEGEIVYMSPLFLTTDIDKISRTLYLGGEGRTYKEMLTCALWLEANWSRWQEGKVGSQERCEMWPTPDFVILRITKGRIVLGENSYYIDYAKIANIKSNHGSDSRPEKSRLTDELIDELVEDISALNEKVVELHKLYEGLYHEQKEEFQKIWMEEWLKFQRENPDLKIEFK